MYLIMKKPLSKPDLNTLIISLFLDFEMLQKDSNHFVDEKKDT